jgi:oxygen-independent coproporphyrinogen III oxidase
MNPDWLAHARRAVPRYTSYPTAADFTAATGEAEAAAWAASVPQGAPLSVYLHIPFCETLCWYCGCATSVPNGYARVGAYAARLLEEADLWARAVGEHGSIGHLHFGGGSPNALRADDFAALVGRLKSGFGLRTDAEIAVELDPRTMHDGQVEAYAAAGVTRVSLGVQTLAPAVQEAVNRIQPPDMVAGLVSDLRCAGINAINMDLMYGLPHRKMSPLPCTSRRSRAPRGFPCSAMRMCPGSPSTRRRLTPLPCLTCRIVLSSREWRQRR